MASSPSPESTPSAATPPPSSSTPPPSTATAPPPTAASPPPVPAATPPPSNDVPPPLVTPPQVAAPPPQPTKPPESSPSPPSGRPESSPPPSVSPQPPERSPSPPDNSPPPVPGNPGNPNPKPPVVPSPELPPQAPPLSPGGNSSSPGGRNSSSSPVSGPPGNTSPSQPPQTVLSPPSVQFPPPRSSGNSPPSTQSPVTPSDRPSARETSKSRDDGGLAGGALAIGLVVGVVVLAIVGVAFWILYNRRRRRKRPDPDGGYFLPLSRRSGFNGGFVIPASHGSVTPPDVTHSKAQSSALITGRHSGISDFVYSSSESGGSRNSGPWFTYEELYKATNGFSAHNLLGEGGFGSVYKGYLPDGRVVAVKHLKVGGGQGEREFKAEVEIISRVHHRHLVALVGYCISQDQRLLVYDYVPNNTLYFHLHGKGRPVLDWEIRVKVAAGAARGIAYLHEDCHPRIVHRDIKSSNILLDDNFEARVADFGLAKLFIDANTHVTTRVMGTFGYMAPEYASSGKLTEKSDVFSYGVLLLELITGRKPVDTSQPSGNESLVEWARPLLSHVLETEDFEGLIDPKLGKNYAKSEVLRMIEAAAACVRHSAAKRPRMGQIVRTFDTLATSDLSNGLRPGESEIHNGAPQSTLVRLFERMVQGGQDSSSGFFSGGVLDTRGSL